MADQDLRIKVSAETGAAQDALGRLANEMVGLAKASEGAGKEQKSLAKQTAEATAKSQAAREAIERAKRAMSEADAVTKAFGKESRETAEAQDRLRRAEEAATKATREAERALEGASKAVSEAAASADKKAQPALLRMNDALQKAGREADKTAAELRTLDARIAASGREADKAAGLWTKFKDGVIMGLGAKVASGGLDLLTHGVKEAGVFAIETAASYETLKSALEVTTGSQAAANAEFERLQRFAAATPFSLEEVAEGYLKLENRGIKATDRLLTSLGNTASAMGKTLDDAIEAVADAVTGESERLKEFGIVGKKSGDTIAYTFRGVTTQVKFDAESITKYLQQIGESNFAGGMEKQAQTLAGLWSTMKDAAAQFAATMMDSGPSDALKEIMRDFTSAAGGSEALAKEMGGALAEALTATYNLMKALIPIIEGTARAFNYVFESVYSINDPIVEAAARVHTIGRETAVAEERLIAYGKAHGAAAGPLGEMIRTTFLGTQAQENYNKAIREGIEAREAQARRDAEIAGLVARRDQETAARTAMLQGIKDERDKAGKMAEFDKLTHDKSLSPSEKKRLRELSKELDIAVPKAGKKKKDTFTAESRDFDSDVAAFEFEIVKDLRAADMEARELAFTRESELREMRLAEMDAELDAAEEFSAEQRRLLDERLQAEIDLARWQEENAVTKEQRERAATAVEAAESKKRIALIKWAAGEEKAASKKREEELEKEAKKREKIMEHVTGAVTTLTESMIGAFERMAQGEKGVMADMLADLLKGIAKKHAILALGEFAQGVGSTAATFGIVNPKAAAHFAAAALHTGVAVAAGVGAYAAGQVADARREGGGGGSGASGFGPTTTPGGGASGSDPGGSGDEGLQAQETPISHEQLRRENAMTPRSGAARMGGAQVVISGTVNLYGAGGRQEFIDNIRRDIDRSDRGGRRNRI